ncbi:MAG TPA: metallophosphoesterase, partial [Candidatus Binatia bacterium]|nr:metallophosphoesterase [Candidatus Binatia bacterium]
KRQLAPPSAMTGKERRWLNPSRGVFKLLERNVDMVVSSFLYPHLSAVWNPYSWLLEKRFALAETSLSPRDWPAELDALRVLLISDIHCGIFLKSQTLEKIISSLMEINPDLVAIAGDIVTGHASELNEFLDALAPLSRAPLGAWYCYGNHDYFGGDPEDIRKNLKSIGIGTLKNDSVLLAHGKGNFVLGGIDDRIMGEPNWNKMFSRHGAPHLLLAHNPDFFYEAESRRIPLTLSGHTHGGQIRLPHRAPILRQSRYCLDEGSFAFRSSLLVVSRGLGSVGLPWRWGADPEAVLIEIVPPLPSEVK